MSFFSFSFFFSGRDDSRFLNLAECVKARRRDREKERCSFWHCPVFCLTSVKLFHVGQSSRCRLSLTLFLWRSSGLASAAYVILISCGLVDGQPLMYFVLIFLVCYLHLIQLTDLSMCEGTDTMKIMVSDQSGAMLYFPLDKSGEVFTSHPRTTVTVWQERSVLIHCNDRQLTLTIMPQFLMLTRAHPFSFHWKGMQKEREGWRQGEWRGGKKTEADWHPVKEKRQIFELQTICHLNGNPSVTPRCCCVGRLSDW